MNKEQNRWKIESLMALLLFGLFAVCILFVLLMGADVYKGLAERDQTGYDRRTAVQYFTTKVRQADRLDCVGAEDFYGLEALVIKEDIEGTAYKTWIYCYDGYIRELFSVADAEMMPEDGDKILPAEALTVGVENESLCIGITTPDGETEVLTLHLRSGKEVF